MLDAVRAIVVYQLSVTRFCEEDLHPAICHEVCCLFSTCTEVHRHDRRSDECGAKDRLNTLDAIGSEHADTVADLDSERCQESCRLTYIFEKLAVRDFTRGSPFALS